MNTLFPIEPIFPPGFSYTENFLSTEEENLLKEISGIELHTFNLQGFEAKRRVASFSVVGKPGLSLRLIPTTA